MVIDADLSYRPPVSVCSAGFLSGRSTYPGAESAFCTGYAEPRGAHLTGTASWHGSMYTPQANLPGYNPMFVPYGPGVPFGQSSSMMPNPWYSPLSSWFQPSTYWMPPYQGYWYPPPPVYGSNPYAPYYGAAAGGYPGYLNPGFAASGNTTGVVTAGNFPPGVPVGPGTANYGTPAAPYPGCHSLSQDICGVPPPVHFGYGHFPVGHVY